MAEEELIYADVSVIDVERAVVSISASQTRRDYTQPGSNQNQSHRNTGRSFFTMIFLVVFTLVLLGCFYYWYTSHLEVEPTEIGNASSEVVPLPDPVLVNLNLSDGSLNFHFIN